MQYDLVIPVYRPEIRGLDRLARQLDSLENSKVVWQDAFIVDGSPEGSRRLEKLCKRRRSVRYIHFPQGIFNKSVLINIGIRESTSTYIAVSDLDSLYSINFMAIVRKVVAKSPGAFILSISYYLPKKLDYSGMADSRWWVDSVDKTDRGIDTACGGVQIAKRSWWKSVRGFDERYVKLGAMDGDSYKRAKLDGLEIIWLDRLGRTTLFHQWHEPTKWKTEDDMAWLSKNREVYYGDDSIKRNLRGWCGEGKYKYKGLNVGHNTVLNRTLNILGAEEADKADIVVGQKSSTAFAINRYPYNEDRFKKIFYNIFKYDWREKPKHASSAFVFYVFGSFMFPRHKQSNKNIEASLDRYISRTEREKCLEVFKKIPLDFCEFETFRVSGKTYITSINEAPGIYPEGQAGVLERKTLYNMYREIGKKIEEEMKSGEEARFNPMIATDIPEGAIPYLKKRIKDKKVADYGAGEVIYLLAKYANGVDCVVSSPYEKEWVEEGLDAFDVENVQVLNNPRGEYDALLIKDFFGGYNLTDSIKHLKSGGWLILDNYKWFELNGKFELERRTRQSVFNWPGIIFSSDLDGGGIMFKQKP